MPPDERPLLTGVLRYLGCLLPGLNGHIVLLPAAALQTTRSHTHTPVKACPWRLGCWDTPEPPCCTHGYWTHAHAYKQTHTHTHLKAAIYEQINTCGHAYLCRDTDMYTQKHAQLNFTYSLTHSHTQRLDFIGNTSALAYVKVIFSE